MDSSLSASHNCRRGHSEEKLHENAATPGQVSRQPFIGPEEKCAEQCVAHERAKSDFMHEIQRALEIALEQGETVYIHCMGGIGRTGTVVGCYLVENGRTGEQAIEEIATLRQGIPSAKYKSPETSAQRARIMNWRMEGTERQAAR